MKKTLLLLAGLSVCSVYAQDALRANLNGLRAGDRIIKQQMEFISPGDDGENVLWDFSGLGAIEEDYLLIYYHENEEELSQLTGWEHQTNYFFKQRGDSLLMTGYSNRFAEMFFHNPEIQIVFPFSFGDSVYSTFSGNGRYYQEMEMTASGHTLLKANAKGTLITPTTDTLKNVLRIKRLREYDNMGVENVGMLLETHLWYAPGYRYPIFETVKSMIIRDDVTDDDYVTAFYFPLAGLENLQEDPENDAIREEMKQDAGILIACQVSPNPVENDCYLNFELSTDAKVTIRLCDIMGNYILPIIIMENLQEGQHQKNIAMNGLRRGNYVIHIQANDYVTSKIVVKK